MVPYRRFIILAAIAVMLLAGLGMAAGAPQQTGIETGGLLPVIPQAQGDRCVEDTQVMRRNHMNLLEHQRDETVLKGIRTKQFSLEECINCHVVNDADELPVTAASPKHFCRSCHDYAAVKIDCFQCHASRPGPEGLAIK